ncbi:MAG: hypothetical protein J5449_00180 [Oscillospiraceae bacterium]|nr:hypothetical protein [Oscillospiraceae bacterium]
MNIPNDAIVKTVPAAAQLRNVKGFNPAKFLRQTVSEQTKKLVYRLDLPYKRAWFRIACPNGRMILRPLRITEELAIIEAQVYMSKDDPQPLSSVISQVDRSETKNGKYIEAAQDKALNEALDNAGFGIQLCDIVEDPGRTQYGSELPVEQVEAAQDAATDKEMETLPFTMSKRPAPVISEAAPDEAAAPAGIQPPESVQAPAQAPAQAASPVAAPMTQRAAQATSNTAQPAQDTAPVKPATAVNTAVPAAAPEVVAQAAAKPTPAPVEQNAETHQPEAAKQSEAPVQETPAMEEAQTQAASESAASFDAPQAAEATASAPQENTESDLAQLAANTQQRVVNFPTPDQRANAPASAPAASADPMPVNSAQAPGYTPNMTVDEIRARMTLEEARAVVVTTGVCKGWTLGQVAESRAPSLKYYISSSTSDNVLKAASMIVLSGAELQKAS